MNALLIMIDIKKNNNNENKEDITNNNFENNNNSFEIDSSEISDNDCDKLQESENNFIKRKKKNRYTISEKTKSFK